MNWMGLFLFLATAIVFTVFGMILMAVMVSKEWHDATTEAYNVGYARGVEKEKERIGKLLDKYIEDLERGNCRDSEGISVSDGVS